MREQLRWLKIRMVRPGAPVLLAAAFALGLAVWWWWTGAAHSQGPLCAIYPIAVHHTTLAGAQEGDIFSDIENGVGAGNFGWLRWKDGTGLQRCPGEPLLNSAGELADSLTYPGNSTTCEGGCWKGYLDPDESDADYECYDEDDDYEINVGDWIWGHTGAVNANAVRNALDDHIDTGRTLRIAVWDDALCDGAGTECEGDAPGGGAVVKYRVSGFALVRLISHNLPQKTISLKFVRWDNSCGQHELYLPLILKDMPTNMPTPTNTPTTTPTPTNTPTTTPTPTNTPTGTPVCAVVIQEPVYEVDTVVTVRGDPGDTIVLRDMDALGVIIGTGTVGPGDYCNGTVAIDVNGNLVNGHIIAAISTLYPSSDTACVGVTACWPTTTPTPTPTPTPTATLTTDPVCSAAGISTTVTVSGEGWPTGEGDITIRWDSTNKITFAAQASWSQDITIDAGEATIGTHTIWASTSGTVVNSPYYIDCSGAGAIDGYTWIFIEGRVVLQERVEVTVLDPGGNPVAEVDSDDESYYLADGLSPGSGYTVIGQISIGGTLYMDTVRGVQVIPISATRVNLVVLPQY
jgi:hypothetical protein